ncbi:MAG: hypothetical protein AAGF88_01890 [Pseudomonadota bacterium]
MTYEQLVVSQTAFVRQRSGELLRRSAQLCQESRWLINASRDAISDLDAVLRDFNANAEAQNTDD